MRYHLFTVAILLAALALYAVGVGGGGSVLLAVGAALELWFWVRALRGGKPVASPAPRVDA
jgi:hypothetical protein